MKESSYPEPAYIPTLDGWRAIAVCVVIGQHSRPLLAGSSSQPAQLLATLFSHGAYGVDIFFALSGYLICTLLLREKEAGGTIDISHFYLRRAFRILPPILLYLVAVTLLFRLHLDDILSVLLFYRNYLTGSYYTMHFWSLAVEEQFYAVVPLFLLLLRRRVAMAAATGLILLCAGIRWFEFYSPRFSNVFLQLQFRTENRFDGLLWGVLLALALRDPSVREWLKSRLTSRVFLANIASALLLLAFFTTPPARRTIVAAALPLLVAHTSLRPEGSAGRFLELPVLRWVGQRSYSLYIWQMLFLVEGVRPLGAFQTFPWALICPVICAAASYHLVEQPMIRLGHRLRGGRRV